MLNKLALGLIFSACATTTAAQTLTNIDTRKPDSAYAGDARGVVVRSPYGLCWRTGYWSHPDSLAGCDGELAPPVLKVTAPALVTSLAPPPTAPIAPTASVSCNFNIALQHEQTFEFDQALLTTQAKARLDLEVVGKLAGCAQTNLIVITGHTDRIGPASYNKKLSEKRAGVIAAYLKARGATAPINATGAGLSQPVKQCSGTIINKALIDCLAPNRRVVIETKPISK